MGWSFKLRDNFVIYSSLQFRWVGDGPNRVHYYTYDEVALRNHLDIKQPVIYCWFRVNGLSVFSDRSLLHCQLSQMKL